MKNVPSTYPDSSIDLSIAPTEEGIVRIPPAETEEDVAVAKESYRHLRRWRIAVWSAAIATSILQSWAFRHVVSSDGIAYLDIARYCARGHWGALVNGYWSPLYPLLLAALMRLLKPSPYWESTVAHVLNVFLFLFALVCFEQLLKALIRVRCAGAREAAERVVMPAQELRLLGEFIFAYSTLMFESSELVHPDLCVAALVFLASALLLRMRAGEANGRIHVAFGCVLALGYLAKQVMFPLALVFLGCAIFATRLSRRSISRAALAFLAFTLVSAPFIFALSRAEGRLTFGDTGAIAYAEMVDGATRFVHWQGGPSGTGTPVHATRLLLGTPAVFEFSTPVGGTYPPWYEPSYWYAGIAPAFKFKSQLRAIRYTIEEYAGILPFMSGLLVGFAALAVFARRYGSVAQGLAAQWTLWIPGLSALSLYALVYVESRLVAPFLVLVWIALFSGLEFPRTQIAKTLTRCVALGIAITLGIGIAWLAGRSLFRVLAPGPFVDWEVAQGLGELGVHPGDKVASIGWGIYGYWAHLADVRIIAEVPPDAVASYWASRPQVQSEVLDDFARAGAKVAVVNQKPPIPVPEWREIGQTGYFARVLVDAKQSETASK